MRSSALSTRATSARRGPLAAVSTCPLAATLKSAIPRASTGRAPQRIGRPAGEVGERAGLGRRHAARHRRDGSAVAATSASVGEPDLEAWVGIVARHHLRPTMLGGLVSWWHSEGDLCREAETFADMTKSRERGFQSFRRTDAAFLAFIERLREARIIPPR